MKRYVPPPRVVYTGVVVVSPMVFGEECKDQDRARFFGPGQIACVCDGVTSSPHSAKAAELVTSMVPVLFRGNRRERLAMMCDLLTAERKQLQATPPSAPGDMPPGMQTMLRKVLQDKQATSFQTTMVAAQVRANEEEVIIDLLRCGDSALFAFSGDGDLLSSSLARPSPLADKESDPLAAKEFRFGPGDQILVRVEGDLGEHARPAVKSGRPSQHVRKWIVCTPVRTCSATKATTTRPRELVIRPDDQLLVPRCLYGRQLESRGRQYRCLDYSSTIRIMPTSPACVMPDGIDHGGSATAVLPDHFYGGRFDSLKDRFPPGTHFVLCSDGFYSAFATASEMWAWLQQNEGVLGNGRQQEPELRGLHRRLHERYGDDDMSLVWMYPVSPSAPIASRVNNERKE